MPAVRKKDEEMIEGLTLNQDGDAKLSGGDNRELVRKIRDVVQDIENLYRPTRGRMPSTKVQADPVMLGLYAARDALIAAEGAILRIGIDDRREEAGKVAQGGTD